MSSPDIPLNKLKIADTPPKPAPKRKIVKARRLNKKEQNEMHAILGPRIGEVQTQEIIDLFNKTVKEQNAQKNRPGVTDWAEVPSKPLFKRPVRGVKKPARKMAVVESTSEDLEAKRSSVSRDDILKEIDNVIADIKMRTRQERIDDKVPLPGDKRKAHVVGLKAPAGKKARAVPAGDVKALADRMSRMDID